MMRFIGGAIVIWLMFSAVMAGTFYGTSWIESLHGFAWLAAFWVVLSLLVAGLAVVALVITYMIDGPFNRANRSRD